MLKAFSLRLCIHIEPISGIVEPRPETQNLQNHYDVHRIAFLSEEAPTSRLLEMPNRGRIVPNICYAAAAQVVVLPPHGVRRPSWVS